MKENIQGCGCLLIIGIIIATIATYGINAPGETATPATPIVATSLPNIESQQLNVPVIVTSLPDPNPQPTITAHPTTDPRPMRPGNCSTAVAMGISAEVAAQWAHLDRDSDGVACYGD